MRTLSIIDLRDFLNKYYYEIDESDENQSYVFESEKCKDFQIIIENYEDENCDRKWGIAIDGLSANSESQSEWLTDREIIRHEVSQFCDWTISKVDSGYLESKFTELKQYVLKEFEDQILLIRCAVR